MIEGVVELHMTEAEVARDLHAVVEKVRQGTEVIIELEHQPVARIMPVRGPGPPSQNVLPLRTSADRGSPSMTSSAGTWKGSLQAGNRSIPRHGSSPRHECFD